MSNTPYCPVSPERIAQWDISSITDLHDAACEIRRLQRREVELIEANNAELERRRQAERERDNMRETWERAWAQPTPAEYQERIRGLLGTIGRFAEYRTAAEAYIIRLRQIVYAGVDTIRAQAGIEIARLDLAGKLESARAALIPARPHQPVAVAGRIPCDVSDPGAVHDLENGGYYKYDTEVKRG
jgi:FtsZ-binding cell division protein ZapB